MNDVAQQRARRREGQRLAVGAMLILVALAGGTVAVVTGQVKWLSLLLCIPLAGMVQWSEDCQRCGGPLRPAVLARSGDEVCVQCWKRER